MDSRKKIEALRKAMEQHGIDAYLIPGTDPHQSEYMAAHWKAREWMTGFTGSAGILIVTADHAGLWTDSRYFLQAEKELPGGLITLHRQLVPHAPEHVDWLVEHLPEGSVVGCDGHLFSVSQIRYLAKKFYDKGIEINHQVDLPGEIWTDRPPIPGYPAFELNEYFAGMSRREKLDLIAKELQRKGADGHLLTALDDIAWTLNIRGADVEFNPVVVCFAYIGKTISYLFISEDKIDLELRTELETDGVFLKPYDSIEDFLTHLALEKKVLVDIRSTSIRLYNALKDEQIIRGESLPRRLKAIKNETEIAHIRQAMLKDGVALTRLFRWLEETLSHRPVSEYELTSKLSYFRNAQGDYFGESFAAIAGYETNGAIVHYRPQPDGSAFIHREGILLLDSGGQYFNGTTDITRTIALGPPTETQKRHFTLVLKGHITLACTCFPEGTTGAQLDTLARFPLWNHFLNYGHGTGHGVGFFLNVHEPPQGFTPSPVTSKGSTAIQPGMLTSNEPGLYIPGAYGIRIENLVLCVEAHANEFGRFFRFETLTLFPIDLNLIDPELLSAEEKNWLNDYHRQVFEKIGPLLEPEEAKWLEERCRPLMGIEQAV